MNDFQRDLIVKQRELTHALIRAWPGGKDSVSFAGVARQVREVMGDGEWRELGGPAAMGRCGYEQFEPDNESTPITEQQALEGINAIRNSIIGAQTWNWSEHGYPLVSLLDRAGYKGLAYPEAKANIGTLIDFREKALGIIRALPARCTVYSDLGDQGELRRVLEGLRDEMLTALLGTDRG